MTDSARIASAVTPRRVLTLILKSIFNIPVINTPFRSPPTTISRLLHSSLTASPRLRKKALLWSLFSDPNRNDVNLFSTLYRYIDIETLKMSFLNINFCSTRVGCGGLWLWLWRLTQWLYEQWADDLSDGLGFMRSMHTLMVYTEHSTTDQHNSAQERT